MEQLLTISEIAFSIFVPFSIYYILIKIVRTAILSTNRWINLDDINFILLTSAIITLISFQDSIIIKILIFVLVLIYSMLLWVDAIIFYLYSFEINKRNVQEFLNDYKSMLHFSARSTEFIKRYPWILFALPLSFITIISIFFGSELHYVHSFVMPIALIVSVFVLQKFSQSITRNIVLFTIIIIPIIVFSEKINLFIGGISIVAISIMFYVALAIIIFLNNLKKTANHTFFSISSHFRTFLRENKLLQNSTIIIEKEHNKLIHPRILGHTPTNYFGLLKGSNVIFVTVESFGQRYINEYKNLRLPFLHRISQDAITSKNHFAISPHTNQFLMHLFGSNYVPKNEYTFMDLLHKSDYNTAFIYSDDLNICEANELLHQIGFQNIIDESNLGKINNRKGDYVLLDSINQIKDLYNNSPCFVQIFTQQSHYPYQVVNKKQFNNYSDRGLKFQYLNALEETDFVLEKLFNELSSLISLDNTLIVYVGDHGESFGELGYKTHSNSTINAQLHVPFLLKHKNLKPQTVKYSTHFDIMPTIMDLLGIKYQTLHQGVSIFSHERSLLPLYYSMIKKDNAPANVKIRLNNGNIMIDRVLNYNLKIDDNDSIIKHLSKDETDYYNALIYRMLLKRNLIYS